MYATSGTSTVTQKLMRKIRQAKKSSERCSTRELTLQLGWQGELKRSPTFRREHEAAEHVVKIYRAAGGKAEDVPAEQGQSSKQYPAQGQ